MDINLKEIGAQLSGQFQGLAGRHPGLWPLAPRMLCAAGVMAGVIALGWFAYWSSQFEEQDALAQQEVSLREAYKSKMSQAINLEALQAQKLQVDQYVERLQKQLPSKAEMAALLTDINQAGLGRGLQFELFKPGNVVVRDYYAEQAIDLKVSGTYHDIGAFAADMANLQRIVTLNNMSLTAGKDGVLMLDAVAKTFRYLDPDEAAAQRKARAEKLKLAKGGAK
ncbi:MAG: Pilus assembly protein PilO [Massilia sp.]|jgi:type IV pilus assembly protein PilO|nr:Pilus assembly protein PilO [Massilia sp.]